MFKVLRVSHANSRGFLQIGHQAMLHNKFFLSVTASYGILPIPTASYRILPIVTASYRFLPIVTDSEVLLRSMGEEGTTKNRQGSSINWEALEKFFLLCRSNFVYLQFLSTGMCINNLLETNSIILI